jgi:hypothetical protein
LVRTDRNSLYRNGLCRHDGGAHSSLNGANGGDMDSGLVNWFGLWEKVSARTGDRYLVGVLHGLRIVIMRDHRAPDDQPQWTVFVAERKQRQNAVSAVAQHSHRSRLPAEPALPLRQANHEHPFDDPLPWSEDAA